MILRLLDNHANVDFCNVIHPICELHSSLFLFPTADAATCMKKLKKKSFHLHFSGAWFCSCPLEKATKSTHVYDLPSQCIIATKREQVHNRSCYSEPRNHTKLHPATDGHHPCWFLLYQPPPHNACRYHSAELVLGKVFPLGMETATGNLTEFPGAGAHFSASRTFDSNGSDDDQADDDGEHYRWYYVARCWRWLWETEKLRQPNKWVKIYFNLE